MESYETIESRMREKYKEITGCDVDLGSDIGIKIKLLAGEIFNLQSSIDWIGNQLFPQSATGEQLDLHARLRGLTRKAPTAAGGQLTFTLDAPAQSKIVIPAITICSTVGKNPVKFATAAELTINVGQQQISGEAFCVTRGADGNVGANTVTVINTTVGSGLTVTNPAAMTGGSDREDDESLRRRIIEDISTPSTGTNKAYYKGLAESVNGVYSANVVPRIRGNGTVNVYIAGRGAVLGSTYINRVQSLMNSGRELNVSVRVYAATLSNVAVSLTLTVKSGYEFEDVKAEVEEKIREYFASLQVGQSVYVSSLSAAISSVQGVEKFNFKSASQNDVAAAYSQLLTAGTITIDQG